MVDVVKQSFDVELQNPIILPAPLARYLHGIQRRFCGSISVGVWQEDRLHSRFKDHFNNHLRHTIRYGRYAQNAFPAILLRNGHRFYRRREVSSRRHSVPNTIQIPLQLQFKVVDRFFIHACRTRVRFHGFPGFDH
jgi:hypothetical protein